MNLTVFFKILFHSFFSTKLYIWLIKKAKGYGIKYFILLNILCLIPVTTSFYYKLSKIKLVSDLSYIEQKNIDFNYVLNLIVDRMPVMHIKNGTVSIDEVQPYIIENPKSHEPLAIFDTSGKYTHLKNSPAILLITTKDISIKLKNGQIFHNYIGQIFKDNQITINRSVVENFITILSQPLRWASLLLIGSFITLLINIMSNSSLIFMGLTLIVLAKYLKLNLTYQALLRLLIVASGPALIVKSISYGLFNYQINDLLVLLTTYIYSINALINYKDSKP